jgi:hypothetical protein
VKFIVLFLLLALPTRGQQQVNVIPVVRGALLQVDGGIVDVKGGTWFSTGEVIAMGKDHADLRKQNEDYEAHVADVPYKWILGTAGAALALGIILGAAGARMAPR